MPVIRRKVVVGEHIIREPFVEARCVPLRDGGWQVTTRLGTTTHPHAGDPYLALDRHLDEYTELRQENDELHERVDRLNEYIDDHAR